MRITKVELKNFKRFTDLTIDGIPADAKLVLLIGSNGSGKSSVFDAFEYENSRLRIISFDHAKDSALRRVQQTKELEELTIRLTAFAKFSAPLVNITTNVDSADANTSPKNNYYGRSSYRQILRLTTSQINGRDSDIRYDYDRPKSFTERDERFSNDIERISRQIFREIFRNGSSAEEIRNKYIEPVNQAFTRIFRSRSTTSLSLIEFIPPGEGLTTQVTFRKGDYDIPYDDLSAGEKEVFNILFNLLARRDQFTDTVYFFDEIDLHLNTTLQANLLEELIKNWIPENCQLWTASHSLGFIDYARKFDKGVIIDFDDLDFDQPQTLFPQPKEQLDVYDIAVPKEMLFEIMKGKKIILCENQNDDYYNLLALPNTLFIGLKDARSLFLQIKNDPRYFALRDRDFLSDTEIERLKKQYPNYYILRYYDFENYLYHPDNIAELRHPDFDKDAYRAEILRQKKERFNSLLLNLKSSRSYEELKTGDIMDKTPDSIVEDLQTDDFDRFYKYFDMKDAFNKAFLVRFNLDKKSLVQTRWFRQQIEDILNP